MHAVGSKEDRFFYEGMYYSWHDYDSGIYIYMGWMSRFCERTKGWCR